MRHLVLPSMLLAALALGGCASIHRMENGGSTPSASTAPAPAAAAKEQKPESANGRIVKSEDGSFTGEIDGTAAAGSKFSKVKIGMDMFKVSQLIGSPDYQRAYATGKAWIPFYFGNDATRLQAYYKGSGCLIFTGGNAFGGGGHQLIRIQNDPKGSCMSE
jgi:uncharacterized protein YceK